VDRLAEIPGSESETDVGYGFETCG